MPERLYTEADVKLALAEAIEQAWNAADETTVDSITERVLATTRNAVTTPEWRSSVKYPGQPPVSHSHATQRAAELFVEGEVEHGAAEAGVVQHRLVTGWETVG